MSKNALETSLLSVCIILFHYVMFVILLYIETEYINKSSPHYSEEMGRRVSCDISDIRI